MTITFYGAAKNAQGKIEQLLVTVVPGQKSSQEWTGRIYRTQREAGADLERLNCRRSA